MKAKISIEFKRIGRFKVNEKLLRKEPKLESATKKTLEEVCKNLEKYFKEKDIEIIALYKIEKW